MEVKSNRSLHEDEEDDDEEFVSRKGVSSQKGDGKSTDQKANTPRSKHSATEQRRRSKINDRFQILRDLIPQNDQKRDKASFLLEVIEYVQFLQEKVQKYEGTYQGWNQEPVKLRPWWVIGNGVDGYFFRNLMPYGLFSLRNAHPHCDSMIDLSRTTRNGPGPSLMFSGKFDDNSMAVAPTMLTNTQNPVESDLTTSTAYKQVDHHLGLANKAVQLPMPVQTNMLTTVASGGALAQPQQGVITDVENVASQRQPQVWQSRPLPAECPIITDIVNEQEELDIEGGTINIAGVYSQGLLNNLTQALHSSGVDLSQASISVQIDLGKRAINRLNVSKAKDNEDPSANRAMGNSRVGSSGEDSDQAQKRLKIEKPPI
ncbi:transcription factor BIM2-like isoform X1 [Papaver somniferum]|uniref:transcription factor BIM2-like isoform X1 n=1 Tax=Papaver somniferum TaxID=3469 RepID=UPI000E7033EE|nr:transcription factor BIM2-like isoform X1 [Papaver somniferum]